MATVTNPNLTLTESEGRVTVRVRYDANFTPFERQLAALGKTWHSHVTLHGIDGSVVGDALPGISFPQMRFAVTAGSDTQVLPFDEDVVVDRSLLQEDAGADADEVKAKIRLHSPEVLEEFTADQLSDRESMLG